MKYRDPIPTTLHDFAPREPRRLSLVERFSGVLFLIGCAAAMLLALHVEKVAS